MIRSISIYDLMEIPQTKEFIRTADAEGFKGALHYLGFDVNREIREEEHYHRPLFTGKEVKYGKVWFGFERSDKEWLASGAASLENRISVIMQTDESLADELSEMCSYPEIADMMIRHARNELHVFNDEFKQ